MYRWGPKLPVAGFGAPFCNTVDETDLRHRAIAQSGASLLALQRAEVMKEQTAWSFSLGQWMGVNVRIHMFVLLFALVTISLAWHFDEPGTLLPAMGLATAVAVSWIAALVIHESGHFLVAGHLGGDIRSATLYPWGSDFDTSSAAGWTRFFVYLAGPAANLFAAAFLSVVLIAFRKDDAPISPGFFNLLNPDNLLLNKFILDDCLRILIWANWLLAVINLVPAFFV